MRAWWRGQLTVSLCPTHLLNWHPYKALACAQPSHIHHLAGFSSVCRASEAETTSLRLYTHRPSLQPVAPRPPPLLPTRLLSTRWKMWYQEYCMDHHFSSSAWDRTGAVSLLRKRNRPFTDPFIQSGKATSQTCNPVFLLE